MAIEIDIQKNENFSKNSKYTYQTSGIAHKIDRALYYPEGEAPYVVDIVGWQNGKAVNANVILVNNENSSPFWLVYGGNQGLRLRKHHLELRDHTFDLNHENEWGVDILKYDKDTYELAIDPYLVEADGKPHKGWVAQKIDWVRATLLSLLKTGLSPKKLSIGLTLGIIIGTFPIVVEERVGRSSNVKFLKDGSKTLLLLLRIIMIFNPLKIFFPASALIFFMGTAWGVAGYFLAGRFPNTASLLVIMGMFIFFFGLLADQISMLNRTKR